VQLSPPLVAGETQLDEIEAMLRTVLTEATTRFAVSSRPTSPAPPEPTGRLLREP
jgi:hypothetical protein